MEKQINLAREAVQRKRPVEPSPASPLDTASTVLALIEKVALDPRADVEKLERLTTMYDRLKAKEAELAYNAGDGPDPQTALWHQDRQEPARYI